MVKAAQTGSEAAVEELFRRHWPRTHRAAYLIVHDAAAAEDIAQEAFLSALSALDRFDRRRPFGPWLHRIAVNRAIDWSRARARAPRGGGEPATLIDAAGAAPAAEELARGGELEAALAASPPSTAPWSSSATCSTTRRARSRRMLDLPRGTVNSRLRRALDRLVGAARGGAMSEARLREALLDASRPRRGGGRGARRWRLVRAAYAAEPPRAPAPAPRRRPPRPAVGGRGRPARRR